MNYDKLIEALAKARDLAEEFGREELISATEVALAVAHRVAYTEWRKDDLSRQGSEVSS